MAYEYFDEDMLREINDSVDIVEYVSQSLELTKRGNDYFAHCPKHIDRTPSLSFNPKHNLFYCFSCGRSGGIINYLIEYEDLSFNEAVKKVSKLGGVDISKMCQSQTIMFLKKLKQANNAKSEKCHHRIIEDIEYDKYDKVPITEWEREGIKSNVLDYFDVRIDTFQNRIVYPVHDFYGNLINVKGRTRYSNFKELGIPKYINYYPIGVMDYFQGLDKSYLYVKKANEIIIFESLKSVMKLYGWGIKNCVSAEKHTITKEQFSILTKLRVDVVFAYDSDIDYRAKEVAQSIDKLKRITNVYIINDDKKLLGGVSAKNSPADCGEKIWNELYRNRKKVV